LQESKRHGVFEEYMMSKPFKGTVNVDIRDSVPDWSPFEPPKAPEGRRTSSISCSTTSGSQR